MCLSLRSIHPTNDTEENQACPAKADSGRLDDQKYGDVPQEASPDRSSPIRRAKQDDKSLTNETFVSSQVGPDFSKSEWLPRIPMIT